MHKDDAYNKDSYVKHSRNSGTGKQGHNRMVRRRTKIMLRKGGDPQQNSTSYHT